MKRNRIESFYNRPPQLTGAEIDHDLEKLFNSNMRLIEEKRKLVEANRVLLGRLTRAQSARFGCEAQGSRRVWRMNAALLVAVLAGWFVGRWF